MAFDTFVQRRLFDPLAMRSSYWTVPQAQAGRLIDQLPVRRRDADAARSGATSVWLKPPSFPYGGAGLVMSARDYDIFLHMLQDGGVVNGVRVAKATTVATMMSKPAARWRRVWRHWRRDRRHAGAIARLRRGWVGVPDRRTGRLSGQGHLWLGWAAGTIAFVDPVHHSRATLMVNYMPAERWPTRMELAGALAKDAARFGTR